MLKHKVNLSSENKVHFWSIFTTGVVGLFSLWLGIAIQDDINTKNAKETQKLARYQMVEAVYPKFSQYIDTGGYVFFDLIEMSNSISEDSIVGKLGEYYNNEQNQFIETMKNSVNFMCDNRYYFGKIAQEKICENNTSILFGMRLAENHCSFLQSMVSCRTCNDLNGLITKELCSAYYAKNTFSFKNQTIDNIQKKANELWKKNRANGMDSLSLMNTALYSFIFVPYIENFNIYSEELIPNDEVTSHLLKHIFVLVGCIILSLVLCVALLHYVFGINIIIKKQK